MKKRLPEPSSEYEKIENFVDEIIIPQQQVEVNNLFYITSGTQIRHGECGSSITFEGDRAI